MLYLTYLLDTLIGFVVLLLVACVLITITSLGLIAQKSRKECVIYTFTGIAKIKKFIQRHKMTTGLIVLAPFLLALFLTLTHLYFLK